MDPDKLDRLIFGGDDQEDGLSDLDRLIGIEEDPQQNARGKKDRPLAITDNPRHARRAARREYRNTVRIDNAIEALGGLPRKNETWHQVMNANYDSFDFVPAMLALKPKHRIEELYLASLGFNAKNTLSLIELLKGGRIARASMLVSLYYVANPAERDVCYTLQTELPKFGGFYHASRSHAKLILARFSDRSAFVIESSANLRTCRCIEQFAITQDAKLFDFHAGWIRAVYEAETKKDAAAGKRRD